MAKVRVESSPEPGHQHYSSSVGSDLDREQNKKQPGRESAVGHKYKYIYSNTVHKVLEPNIYSSR